MLIEKYLFLGLLLLAPSMMSFGQMSTIDEVIAVVGDNPVLRSDVEYQYQQAMMQGSSFPGDLKCHIFEQLLLEKLLLDNSKNIC